MNKNVSILISIVLIILVTSVSRAESVDPPKDAVVRVGLSYGNPVLPESLTAISLYIRTSDKTFLEQTIEQFEWWKYINVQFQTVGLDSLSEGGALSDVRDAKKYWQFTKPVLSNPLENSENDIKEVRGGYHIEKTFILATKSPQGRCLFSSDLLIPGMLQKRTRKFPLCIFRQ